MRTSINVLVTGIGGGGLGEQLIKALRLSDSVKYNITGTDITNISKGMMEVDFPATVLPASDPAYIQDLLELCIRQKIEVLLPGSEPELKVISLAREKFTAKNIFLPINTQEVLDICFDKMKTTQFLKENGFTFPRSVRICSETDLNNIDFNPIVLKPSVGGSGSANIMIAQNKQELLVFGKYLLNIYNEFMAQEYVGTPEEEFTVGVLCSMESEVINSIALKRKISNGLGCKIKVKNRTHRVDLGNDLVISSGISQGEIGQFEHITKECEKIALALGARSAINIQCRFFKNQVYVFEINPRFSGTSSLRAMMGYNEPDLLIRKYILKETIMDHFPYRGGQIMRGLSEMIIR